MEMDNYKDKGQAWCFPSQKKFEYENEFTQKHKEGNFSSLGQNCKWQQFIASGLV